MFSPCSDDGGPCGGGNGLCAQNSSTCICNDPNFGDQSDFALSSGCAVNLKTFNILWSISIIWYATTVVLAGVAMYKMKRKTPEMDRMELKQHMAAFFSSVFATLTSILQISYGTRSGGIGVEPITTVFYALSQILVWSALILKPSTKSETSIARFAMEQNGAILRLYSVLAPIFILLMGAAAITAVAASLTVSHEVEDALFTTHFVLMCLGFVFVAMHMIVAIITARRQLERALANSAIVSKRASVRVRLEKFIVRAKTVWLMSLFATLIAATFCGVLAFCLECRHQGSWVITPVQMGFCGFWLFRGMLISIQASAHNRDQSSKQTRARLDQEGNLQSSSAETKLVNVDPNSVKVDSKKKSHSRSKFKIRGASGGHKVKKMTVVVEADYEGTVTLSQMESQGAHTAPQRSPRAAAALKQFAITEEGESESFQ